MLTNRHGLVKTNMFPFVGNPDAEKETQMICWLTHKVLHNGSNVQKSDAEREPKMVCLPTNMVQLVGNLMWEKAIISLLLNK